jgi:transketolase
MREAMAPGRGKPVMVVLNTIKGRGIAEMEGKMESHYLPLTQEQYANAVASFEVPA